jgi:uncharacterized ferritin-like protein (DUF455 family)
MHDLAEYGIAAHVIYKEGGPDAEAAGPEKMTWLRQLLEAEKEADPKQFLEALKVDLFEDEVFVFTPKGEVKNLSRLTGRRAWALPDAPARDERFYPCRFYWPDIVDPTYPYGEGARLQLRSAVSHANELWAVEFGGAVLHGLAAELPWEFSLDAARWTYDESRHVRMGLARLEAWGYAPAEIPMGTYIYTSARGESPLVRLAMLHYFETKNIGQKTVRAQAFGDMQDKLSQHDMEFDWADETIHAHYGRTWYEALRARRPAEVPDLPALREHCRQLVAREAASAAPAEVTAIHAVAEAMVAKAASQ